MRANQRNLAKRRLRHLMRERLDLLPAHTVLVIRVLPGLADLNFTEISAALDAALTRALKKLETTASNRSREVVESHD